MRVPILLRNLRRNIYPCSRNMMSSAVAQPAAASVGQVQHPDHGAFTETLEFRDRGADIDTYRVLDEEGNLLSRPRVMVRTRSVKCLCSCG